jgi:hypothetical protein
LNEYRNKANGILGYCDGNDPVKVKPWPKGYPPEKPVYLDEQEPTDLSEKGI